MHDLAPMIRLDVANLTAFRRAVIPVLAGLVFMAWSGGMLMAALMLYLLGFLVAINAFSMDDQHHLPILYAGLPVTRRTVVTSHYLVGAAAFMASALLVIPCALISHAGTGASPAGELHMGAVIVLATSLVTALALPLVIRFGTRSMVYASLGVAIIATALSWLARHLDLDVSGLIHSATQHQAVTTVGAVIIVGLVWVGSWTLACRLFQSKDF